jgi:hypothetical protein
MIAINTTSTMTTITTMIAISWVLMVELEEVVEGVDDVGEGVLGGLLGVLGVLGLPLGVLGVLGLPLGALGLLPPLTLLTVCWHDDDGLTLICVDCITPAVMLVVLRHWRTLMAHELRAVEFLYPLVEHNTLAHWGWLCSTTWRLAGTLESKVIGL